MTAHVVIFCVKQVGSFILHKLITVKNAVWHVWDCCMTICHVVGKPHGPHLPPSRACSASLPAPVSGQAPWCSESVEQPGLDGRLGYSWRVCGDRWRLRHGRPRCCGGVKCPS